MTTTVRWKEPFLQFKCWFLPQCPVPSQRRMAVCQLVHGIPETGHRVEKSSCILVSGTQDIRFGLRWLEKGKFTYFILHLHLVLSTLPSKEMGYFWECKLHLSKASIQLETNVCFLCPLSTQLKIKPSIRCTPLYQTLSLHTNRN